MKVQIKEKNKTYLCILVITILGLIFVFNIYAEQKYLGRLSTNKIASDSTSNPVGQYGNTVSSTSINNPVGQFGSSVSSNSARNPLATNTPKLYSQDGKYLGKVSSNTLDPDSISNPVGRYGSPVSADSVNNPVGRYGSPVSSESANNPLATNAPRIIYDEY